MDISTTRVEPHEIAKSEDFEFGFQSLIRNTAILDRMLTSADIDYVAGGSVKVIEGTMTVSLGPIWANGKQIDLPAYSDKDSDPVPLTAPTVFPRIDIIQARGYLQEFDRQRRAFYDPELQVATYQNINTKNRLIVEIMVKEGSEGVDHAPEADTGFVKIAEVFLDPETIELLPENIKNVTATYQGEENADWTTEKTRTFLIGSISDVWASFNKEHYPDGRHREAVIKASNILRGIYDDALTGAGISVGEDVNSGDLSLLSEKTILEALVSIGQILQGATPNTLLKKLSMLIAWKSTETYQPFMPAFFQGRIYYANPTDLPGIGQSPGNTPSKWLNAAGDVPFYPKSDDRLYGMRNRVWTELNTGGLAIEALKFFSKKSIMFTNARIVDRRLRGWDLGLLYLSNTHEVYHFDTDNNNQNQETNITINYTGDAPVRKGKEDTTEEMSFDPAVSDIVPFEMMGKSLYGAFSVAGQVAAQNSTLEMWMKIFVAENSVLLRLGSQAQDMVTLNIGGADPEYSSPAEGDPPYSSPDSIDGIPYCSAKTTGNTLFHDWGEGNESVDLDEAGVVLTQRIWLHVAFVLTADTILFFIGENQFSFDRMRTHADPLAFTINEGLEQFNLDELSIIAGAALTYDAFSANTAASEPYAALDYKQKYAVIMVDDPEKLRTNIFESDQFKEAVQAIIDGD